MLEDTHWENVEHEILRVDCIEAVCASDGRLIGIRMDGNWTAKKLKTDRHRYDDD